MLAYKEFVSQFTGLLPLSAHIDILLFLLGLKTCMRTCMNNAFTHIQLLQSWSMQFSLYFDIDHFVYLAKDKQLLLEVKRTDHSLNPHEIELGALFGYPLCCCEKIAQVGEENIDTFEEQLIQQSFVGEFQLINPSGYRQGKAFISHVPCTTSCQNSLKQAKILAGFILDHKEESILKPWVKELEKMGFM
jgi:hypothetical protein